MLIYTPPKKPADLTGQRLADAIAYYDKMADDNYEVSKDIQERDGVDRKGRKVKRR
jgi:hypothetical protein